MAVKPWHDREHEMAFNMREFGLNIKAALKLWIYKLWFVDLFRRDAFKHSEIIDIAVRDVFEDIEVMDVLVAETNL